MASYRMDEELEQGLELLCGRTFLGCGFSAETLFPELAEEEARSGINIKEYEERINSMGFLKCVDGLDPDELLSEEPGELENDLISNLDSSRASGASVDEEVESYYTGEYANLILSGFMPPWQTKFKVNVVFSEKLRIAKRLRKKHNFVIYHMPNGSAVFI